MTARQLISQLAQVWIGHCYREANACADFLARKGALQASSFILYQDPPVDLLELIISEKLGLYCNRVIPALSVSQFFLFNAISPSPKKKKKKVCLCFFSETNEVEAIS